ncbi:MerR family transcriptional regulator [Quadrisphaera sp. DSM 44207]|uniref:MerR family transcriptional regulator n=1 Tax=Quadrisphaera sp. DSM 44207 TaxID=1881057 RepID=UPI0008856FB1|nr:MerR family transcriptional regulator [Quadrisphaera sp. DSM 44207]SDQ70024.1 DNA-binding transcriptional regulator, MerR family [Quadrisphaera sp. DSM 44207]
MVSIGEFARLGGVSVRMLRHYDAVGLLPPHAVDPASSYRSYAVEQLRRLHRITALTSLGLTLAQVQAIVDDEVPPPDLRGVLALRRDELRARIAADTARLHSVEARLRALEAGAVSTHDTAAPRFTLRSLEPVRLAQLTAAVPSSALAGSGPVDRLFAELDQRLQEAGVEPAGPRVVHHGRLGKGVVEVHAGVVVAEEAALPAGVEEARLPGIATAACLVVTGAVEDADADARTLAWWMHDNGYRYSVDEPAREVYLEHRPEDPARTVVELQMGISPVP